MPYMDPIWIASFIRLVCDFLKDSGSLNHTTKIHKSTESSLNITTAIPGDIFLLVVNPATSNS